MLINFVDATNDANHYTKPPHVYVKMKVYTWQLNNNLSQRNVPSTDVQSTYTWFPLTWKTSGILLTWKLLKDSWNFMLDHVFLA